MSCYEYWEKIKKIANDLTKCDQYQELSIDDILSLLDSVEEIAHDSSIDFDSAKHILDDEKMNEALKIIRKFYLAVGEKLENEKAQEILRSPDPWKTMENFHFYERYQKLIRNEDQLVEFKPGERVVFIGGGPLPLTLLLLNKLFCVQGVSIEVNPEIALFSRRVLEKLHLNSQIEVIVGDETQLRNLGYDVVMVAALAEPKKRVFANIRKMVDSSTPIIYRTYTGMRAILYAPVTEDVLEGFERMDVIFPTGKVNNTSVLIKKTSIREFNII